MLSDKIIRAKLVQPGASPAWVAMCINCGPAADFLREKQTGMDAAQMNISQQRLSMAPILVPAAAEQHRIVAKIDELMALIDRLEQHLTKQFEAHQAFAAAAVHHLDTDGDAARDASAA